MTILRQFWFFFLLNKAVQKSKLSKNVRSKFLIIQENYFSKKSISFLTEKWCWKSEFSHYCHCIPPFQKISKISLYVPGHLKAKIFLIFHTQNWYSTTKVMLKHTTPFHNRVKSSIFFKPVGGVKIATCQMVAKNAKMDFMELFFDKVCVKKWAHS